jgi:hypothetical protein
MSYSMPTQCEWSARFTLSEAAAGDDFTILITNTRKVILHNRRSRKLPASIPRGLSANGSRYAFAFATDSVFVGSETTNVIRFPRPIVLTAVTARLVAALDQAGIVSIWDCGSIKELPLPPTKRIAASGDFFVCIGMANDIFVCQETVVRTFCAPIGFDIADAVYANGQIVALGADGEIATSREGSSELALDWDGGIRVPDSRPVAFVALYGGFVLFVAGRPPAAKRLPVAVGVRAGDPLGADTFVCADSEIAYLSLGNVPFGDLASLIAAEAEGGAFVTAGGRVVRPDDDGAELFRRNFLRGDLITIGGSRYSVVGIADGAVWVRGGLHYVVALPDDAVSRVTQLERAGHTVVRVKVDGMDAWVDQTASFCASFGYEPGDLVWAEGRGVVEFFGVSGAKCICLDLSTRCLFALEDVAHRVLKRASKRLPHTRTVVATDGAAVELDISAHRRPFMPTDRVMSPLGEATVIGFRDAVYIQTDEMRMSGYQALAADIFRLRLIRRISAKAERNVHMGGGLVTVSLNTEDAIGPVLPGDAVCIGRRHAKIVGFRGGSVVVKFADEKQCEVCTKAVEIIYRADIAATRVSHELPPVEVGSPLISKTNLLPGDIVEAADLGECEFYGCATLHTMFVSRTSREVFALSFAMLLFPGFFTVKERPALDHNVEE